MSDPSDKLVWDGELGWFDPEFPLESLGISCDETAGFYRYRIGGMPLIQIQKEGLDIGQIRLCVEDAEKRSKAAEEGVVA